ncbi:flagellar hook-length control protein FliK [Myxococcota bacterium]|nr:flagellar hook-length control protein FliK [Myxococcota bacterium]
MRGAALAPIPLLAGGGAPLPSPGDAPEGPRPPGRDGGGEFERLVAEAGQAPPPGAGRRAARGEGKAGVRHGDPPGKLPARVEVPPWREEVAELPGALLALGDGDPAQGRIPEEDRPEPVAPAHAAPAPPDPSPPPAPVAMAVAEPGGGPPPDPSVPVGVEQAAGAGEGVDRRCGREGEVAEPRVPDSRSAGEEGRAPGATGIEAAPVAGAEADPVPPHAAGGAGGVEVSGPSSPAAPPPAPAPGSLPGRSPEPPAPLPGGHLGPDDTEVRLGAAGWATLRIEDDEGPLEARLRVRDQSVELELALPEPLRVRAEGEADRLRAHLADAGLDLARMAFREAGSGPAGGRSGGPASAGADRGGEGREGPEDGGAGSEGPAPGRAGTGLLYRVA